MIGMEALSGLLKRAVEGNFISGYRFEGRDGGELIISHLLYADDTVMFCDAKSEQMMYLGWILMWFEVSGLRINLSKSEIIPVGTVSNVETLAIELGCGVGSLPTTYLGLPLGAPHKLVRVWDSIVESFRKRLASWKRQYISRVVFEDVASSAHRMKITFLCTLWSWANLYSVDNIDSLMDFLVWLGYR